MKRAKGFWRSAGFCRIAMSKWFGFAMDAYHPFRRLAAEDDCDFIAENIPV
jgi:hypothetical protein